MPYVRQRKIMIAWYIASTVDPPHCKVHGITVSNSHKCGRRWYVVVPMAMAVITWWMVKGGEGCGNGNDGCDVYSRKLEC